MLNTKQERAIFLLTAGISPITIVQELEITNEILHGWLQQDYFMTALTQHKNACREANRNRLEYLFGRALNALDDVLKTGNASEKLQAVELLFDRYSAIQPVKQELAVQTAVSSTTQPSPEPEAEPEILVEPTKVHANVQVKVDKDADSLDLLDLPSLKIEARQIEHENFSEVDETILEECLDDLQLFLNGGMPIEKAKARLYPIIDPNHLNLESAKAILPDVIKQVSINHTKNSFVIKT